MSAVGTFRAGKTGQARVDGTNLKLEDWTCNYSGVNIETTNFESGGFYQGVTGIIKLDWTLRGQWDFAESLINGPPGLYPRDDGVGLLLTMATGFAAQTFVMTSFMVDKSNVAVSTKGNVAYDSSGTSQGDFTVTG